MPSLKDILIAGASYTADGRVFFRNSVVDEVFTQERIVLELQVIDLPHQARSEITKQAQTTAKLVFAILIRISKITEILRILERGIHDERLPLQIKYEDVPQEFYLAQWEFIAVRFRRQRLPMLLENETILPFVEDEKISRGAYGSVFRIKIPADHQDLVDNAAGQDYVFLSRKRLEISAEKEVDVKRFRDEDRILKMLSALKNPNIIDLLVSYRHKDVYNFIFPLADMDLASFLEQDALNPHFKTRTAYLKALQGVASALCDIHDFNAQEFNQPMIGCHHDIKPQNILVKGARFLLADFGLSRLNHISDDSKSIFKAMGDYAAPECRGQGFERLKIGRKSDVWSLGCIAAEVGIHMYAGAAGVSEFRRARESVSNQWTDHSFHHSGQLKPKVRDSIRTLRQEMPDSSLDQILRISLLALAMNPEMRPTAAMFRNELLWAHFQTLVRLSLSLFRELVHRSEDANIFVEESMFRSWANPYSLDEQPPNLSESNTNPESPSDGLIEILEKINEELRRLVTESNELTNEDEDTKIGIDTTIIHYLNKELIKSMTTASKKQFDRRLFLHLTQSIPENRLQSLQEITASLPETREVGALLALKYLSQRDEASLRDQALRLALDARSFVPDEMFEGHTIGEYSSAGHPTERVLVEWRSCRVITDKATLESAMTQVQLLADMPNVDNVPETLRILKCIGFFLSTGRNAFGMVYRFPNINNPQQSFDVRSRSLRSIIRSTKDVKPGRPFLGERFRIAAEIASCVFDIHIIGWYHKSLSSQNIAFFPEAGAFATANQKLQPFLIGFNYSRQTSEAITGSGREVTTETNPEEAAYQHPTYRADKLSEKQDKPLYRKGYDYYSLGLLLLEIGLWRTLASIQRKHQDFDPPAFQEILLQKYVPELAFSMGEIYHQAAKICIEGIFGDENNKNRPPEQLFKTRVVDQLGRCLA